MNKKEKQVLYDLVYNYPTSESMGFNKDEVTEILLMYNNVNMEKFEAAMFGNTVAIIDDKTIYYHCDIYVAIVADIENRDLYIGEWD